MKEKNFQTLFGHHLKAATPVVSAAFELKICKNDKPFRFNQLEKHQEEGLLQAKRGLYYKLSDLSLDKKPFDCFWIRCNTAFVIIFFYHPRQEKIFYGIEINDFIKLRKSWKRKSIRESELMATGLVRKLKLKGLKSKKKNPPVA